VAHKLGHVKRRPLQHNRNISYAALAGKALTSDCCLEKTAIVVACQFGHFVSRSKTFFISRYILKFVWQYYYCNDTLEVCGATKSLKNVRHVRCDESTVAQPVRRNASPVFRRLRVKIIDNTTLAHYLFINCHSQVPRRNRRPRQRPYQPPPTFIVQNLSNNVCTQCIYTGWAYVPRPICVYLCEIRVNPRQKYYIGVCKPKVLLPRCRIVHNITIWIRPILLLLL